MKCTFCTFLNHNAAVWAESLSCGKSGLLGSEEVDGFGNIFRLADHFERSFLAERSVIFF